MEKKIIMAVNTQIQKDARVLRAAKSLNMHKIVVLSMNGDKNFHSDDFRSVIYENYKSKGFLLNLQFWLFIIRYCFLHRKEYDLLYIHDYPIVIAGYIASLLCRKKWCYDAHELLLNHKSFKMTWRRKCYIFLERMSCKHADLVIAANYERERIIRYVYKLQNTINVNNIADIVVDIPLRRKEIVVFQGAIVKDRDLHPFIDALPKLNNQLKLKIVGGGDCLNHYVGYVKDKSLEDRVFFTGGLPYSELMKQSADAKIGIIVYQMTGLNYIYCEPNKIYEYAQARLPMLVSPQSKLRYLISKYHVGEVLNYPLSPLDIAAKISKILNNYDSYLIGFDEFNRDFSFEKEKVKLLEAVNAIIDSSF